MKNSETGEYEVVVGNRQLLSGFFIVMLLCGVAFAMGYLVGQNSPRSSRPQVEAAAPVPFTEEGQGQPSPLPAPAAAATEAAVEPASTVPADAAPQPTTQPARDPQQVTAAPAPAPSAPAEAAPGSFWQVGAFRQESDAQPTLQTLLNGGMPASLQKGTDGWVRVMVGPYSDTPSMSRAKSELETRFRFRSLIRK